MVYTLRWYVAISDGVERSTVFYETRRSAILYFYLLFGSPSNEVISDGEIVSEICRRLIIPTKRKVHILKILQDIISDEESGNRILQS